MLSLLPMTALVALIASLGLQDDPLPQLTCNDGSRPIPSFDVDDQRILAVFEAAQKYGESESSEILPTDYCLTAQESTNHQRRNADKLSLESRLRRLEWRYFGQTPDRPNTWPAKALWYGRMTVSCDPVFRLEQSQMIKRSFERRIAALESAWAQRFGPQPSFIVIPVARCSDEDTKPRSNRFKKELRRYEGLIEQLETYVLNAPEPNFAGWGFSYATVTSSR